jgi:4-hydroxy-tetrahydrodipicolinate reductase
LLKDWDIELIETHHNLKVDAPSGTAKTILNDIVETNPALTPITNRVGKRKSNEIGVHSLRGGTVAGIHTTNYYGTQESISITHNAEGKEAFAKGALAICEWIMKYNKKASHRLLTMEDMF